MNPFLLGKLLGPLLVFVPWIIIAMVKRSDRWVWYGLTMLASLEITFLFGAIFGIAVALVMVIIQLILNKRS